jgi:uncharacterized membrane protein SpoIIM required for sporulation
MIVRFILVSLTKNYESIINSHRTTLNNIKRQYSSLNKEDYHHCLFIVQVFNSLNLSFLIYKMNVVICLY